MCVEPSPSLSFVRRPPLLSWGLFLLIAAGCPREHQEPEEQVRLPVTRPHRQRAEITRDFVAQVRAIQHIELRSLERGYVQGIFVDEGQRVTKGTRMFQIMPMIYQAEAERAVAEARQAEIELTNTRLLAEKNVVSPNELALATARYARAKAEVSLATTHRALTEVRAPFDGIMGRFQVRVGSLVEEGDLLTSLSDNSQMWVYFNVSEQEYLQYVSRPEGSQPTAVRLVMANGKLFAEPGKVQTIEADFNNETGNLSFRATFPNPKGILRHGETGKIQMSELIEDALIIPQKATFDILDKKFVFVVDDKGVVHSQPITIAAELPQVYAVASGLTEKDQILVEGLSKVRDGVTIAFEYKQPAEVLAQLQVVAE
ncbi:MAG: hemolysin D [Myxococcaceae bacterium]